MEKKRPNKASSESKIDFLELGLFRMNPKTELLVENPVLFKNLN